MNTFWVIVLTLLGIIQLGGMVWAWRYVDSSTGDSEYTLLAHILYSIFWPLTWVASVIGRVQ